MERRRSPRFDRPEFQGEATLDELIDDPVAQALMARDGVRRAEIVGLLTGIGARRRSLAPAD